MRSSRDKLQFFGLQSIPAEHREKFGDAVGTVDEGKAPAEFQAPLCREDELFERQRQFLAAGGLFFVRLFKSALPLFIGRVAEDEGKFLGILRRDVLNADMLHPDDVSQPVQRHGFLAHFRKVSVRFEACDTLDVRIFGIEMQADDAASRTKIGDRFPPRRLYEAGEDDRIGGETVILGVLDDAVVADQE